MSYHDPDYDDPYGDAASGAYVPEDDRTPDHGGSGIDFGDNAYQDPAPLFPARPTGDELESFVPDLAYLVEPDDLRGKWFAVVARTTERLDERGHATVPPTPYAHITSGSVSLARVKDVVLRHRRYADSSGRRAWASVCWARNKTQVRDYLLEQGYNTMWGGKLYTPEGRQDMTTVSNRETHDDLIASAQASLERAQVQAQGLIESAARRLQRLLALPREPMPTDDEDGMPPVIFFRKRFGTHTRPYDYAAIRSGNGRWNTTGPKAPKDYSWSELVQWILEGDDEVEIVQAAGWSDLRGQTPPSEI